MSNLQKFQETTALLYICYLTVKQQLKGQNVEPNYRKVEQGQGDDEQCLVCMFVY